jgi:gluconokinase
MSLQRRQVGGQMTATRVLAVDVGSSSVRAQIHDADAVPAGPRAQLRYSTDDPDVIVALTRSAVEAALTERVDAVGVSCFGHSLLPLDGDGRPLTPLLTWRDGRSAGEADVLARELPWLHERTGCAPHSSYWPAKLRWLAGHDERAFRRAARFVSFGGYLYQQLLGAPAPTSISMASSTGLLDVAERRWDDDLLAALGVSPEQLPPVGEEPVEADVPWYPALFDGAASNVGTGCVGSTRAALTVGTSAAVRVLHEPAGAPRDGLFRYAFDDRRVLDGGALSDGGNLRRWLRDTLAPAEAALAERPADGHGLTFLPFLAGERAPWWRERARGAVNGITLATTPADLRQAALEGIALLFRELLTTLDGVEEVVATGAALLADADWMQIMADVLERPVVASAVDEGSARGAAVAAFERLGVATPPAPLGQRFEPRSDRADAYRAAHARLLELYAALGYADA